MAILNVFHQIFAAHAVLNGVERNGALALLISDSEAGQIRYQMAVSFFPHRTPDDFAISYDAYFEETVYEAKGRRSKKREAELLTKLRPTLDAIAARENASIDWDRPLSEARRG